MWIQREKVIDLERRSDEGTRAANKRWTARHGSTVDASPNGSGIADPMQEKSRVEHSRVEKTSLSEQKSSDVADLRPKKPKTELSIQAIRLANLLKAEILRNKADYRLTPAQERRWAVTAQRMLVIDKRDPQEIAEIIVWAQHDQFWLANVLSMDALRSKFDQLQLKRENHRGNGKVEPVKVPSGNALDYHRELLKDGVQ